MCRRRSAGAEADFFTPASRSLPATPTTTSQKRGDCDSTTMPCRGSQHFAGARLRLGAGPPRDTAGRPRLTPRDRSLMLRNDDGGVLSRAYPPMTGWCAQPARCGPKQNAGIPARRRRCSVGGISPSCPCKLGKPALADGFRTLCSDEIRQAGLAPPVTSCPWDDYDRLADPGRDPRSFSEHIGRPLPRADPCGRTRTGPSSFKGAAARVRLQLGGLVTDVRSRPNLTPGAYTGPWE